jgi:hypothetical protein
MLTIVGSFTQIPRGLQFTWTSDHPCTAQIHISGFLYEGVVEVLDGDHRVIEWVVDVPLVSSAMEEDGDLWKSPVSVDYVSVVVLLSNPGYPKS